MPVILGFERCAACCKSEEKNRLRKQNFIREATPEERNYLESVFSERERNPCFSAAKGKNELFYPYTKNGRTVVFHFLDYQRYGGLGSS